MLKITAIGNLTNDVELKMNETTGKPYAILRICLLYTSDAVSWRPPAILRPLPLRASRSVSPVSSSKPARWSSFLPAR
mgnify:CR=1 FL=1